MDRPPLLQLPTEILVNILKFAASCASPPPQATLVNVALTCSELHHTVFCTENDLIWREPALAFGVPVSLHLDHVLYPGSSTLQRRLWRNVVKLNLSWRRPFPAGTPTIPRQQKAVRELPPLDRTGDWFGRRIIEVFAAGEGNRRGPSYATKHTTARDDGCAVFQVKTQRGSNGTNIHKVTGVLDPALGKAREVAVETKAQGDWTATPFPAFAGFVVEERSGEYRVRTVDASTASLSGSWNLGRRKPDRVVANGDILVAVTFPDPGADGKPSAPHIPSNLVCVESFGGMCGSRWKARALAKSKVVWELDLSVEWSQEMNTYTSFPHLKNFHITRSHLVCLVTQHPTSNLGKLAGTDFYILELETGRTVKQMRFSTKSSSTLSGSLRAAFTTAFAHDFLLTDTYIVSGGAGGGLLVWNYTSDQRDPIYTIPDPLGSDATKLEGAASFPRQYSALTMSGDGRYVAATTSDQLWLFDMVDKKVHGVYHNGRKIDRKDYYAKNPTDEFPAGVWCWWKEWRSKRDAASGELNWEEVDGRGGVAYLTGLGDEENILRRGSIVSRIASSSHCWNGLALLVSSMVTWAFLSMMWKIYLEYQVSERAAG